MDAQDKEEMIETAAHSIITLFQPLSFPVDKLPNEILALIFDLIAEENQRDTETPTSPWNLLRVCRHWSQVALGTPILWSRLELMTISTAFEDPHLSTSKQRCSTLGQLERALGRSGAALLDVTFSFAGRLPSQGTGVPYREMMQELFCRAGNRCMALDFRSVGSYAGLGPGKTIDHLLPLERVQYIRTASTWYDTATLAKVLDAMEKSEVVIEEAYLDSHIMQLMGIRSRFLKRILDLTYVPYSGLTPTPILRSDVITRTLRLTEAWLTPAIEPGATLLPHLTSCWLDDCKLDELLQTPCTLPSLRKLWIRGYAHTAFIPVNAPFTLNLPNLEVLYLDKAALVLPSIHAPMLSAVELTRDRDGTVYIGWPRSQQGFIDDQNIRSYYQLSDTRSINPTSLTISLTIQEDTLVLALTQMSAIQWLTLLYPDLPDDISKYYGVDFYRRLGVMEPSILPVLQMLHMVLPSVLYDLRGTKEVVFGQAVAPFSRARPEVRVEVDEVG